MKTLSVDYRRTVSAVPGVSTRLMLRCTMREFKPGDKVRHKWTREEGRVLSIPASMPEWIVVQFKPTDHVGYTVLASDFEKMENLL